MVSGDDHDGIRVSVVQEKEQASDRRGVVSCYNAYGAAGTHGAGAVCTDLVLCFSGSTCVVFDAGAVY